MLHKLHGFQKCSPRACKFVRNANTLALPKTTESESHWDSSFVLTSLPGDSNAH